MALNLEYLATDSNEVGSALALAERIPGAGVASTSSGDLGGRQWDAAWIRVDGTDGDVLLEVHPAVDEAVIAARKKWAHALASAASVAPSRSTLGQIVSESVLLCIVTLAGDFDDADVLDQILGTVFSVWPGALFVENDGFYIAGERVLGTEVI